MANLNIPERAVRHQIASAIHAVVQVARLSDGTRKVITISEITGMENDLIAMQDIFTFERRSASMKMEKSAALSKPPGCAPSLPIAWPPAARACVPRYSNQEPKSSNAGVPPAGS